MFVPHGQQQNWKVKNNAFYARNLTYYTWGNILKKGS